MRGRSAEGSRKGLQVAALAAVLVPLGSVPVTRTDQVIGSPRAADAAPGDIRRRADVFDGCSDGGEGFTIGTALTLVPGGKAGFPDVSVFLVTSCRELNGQVPLFFTDADGGEGATKTLTTVFPANASASSLPTNGWEALALRADRGDLLACGRNGNATVLWSIDFSPFNSTPDGTATFLRNGPSGLSCGAIAWDPSDSSVYQTPASGLGILHSTNSGQALAPVAVPTSVGCGTITGLGIAGTSLFVGCSPGGVTPPFVAQLYKVNGSLVVDTSTNTPRKFNYSCGPGFCPATSVLRGVPDDPASDFGDSEFLWTLTDGFQFVAFEMAAGTLGQKTGPPALFPGSCPAAFGGNVASDGDDLLDCWKNRALWSDGLPGISYAGSYATGASPATRDVTLCVGPTSTQAEKDANCAKPGRPDAFLEIDYMDFHRPEQAAIDAVVQMFQNAPNNFNRFPLPYSGIALHVQVDDLVSVNGKNHFANVAFPPCTAPASPTDSTTVDFDAVKRLFFGTAAERASLSTNPDALNAKALVFRYALMAHNLLGLGTTSGCAEILGNDFIVSLGSWATKTFGSGKTATSHGVGNLDQQSGTIAHEFGHTLGLRHGGGDNMNCKPNYPSVMNYNHQFFNPTTRLLDYARAQLFFLDKTNLVEADGVGPSFTGNIAFGPVAPLQKAKVAQAGGPIDWNVDTDTTDVLSLDLAQTTNTVGGCPANQIGAPGNDQGRFFESFDDWFAIRFGFRTSVDFADGGHITAGETTRTLGSPNLVPLGSTPDITLETAASLSNNALPVMIEVEKNHMTPGSNENIDVVILSAAGFDATTVVPLSIRLQGLPPATWSVEPRDAKAELFCDAKDKNGDRRPDLVCKFKIPPGTIGANETGVLLTGVSLTTAMPDGQPVAGTALISVHP